jgi:aquaporin NIP
MKHFLPEFLGTFVLVFAGTGAIIVDHVSGGQISHLGVGLVFGLVVFAMIQTFGGNGGAHFNPAVTLGLATAGRFPWAHCAPCITAQLCEALSASGVLRLLFPESPTLGETIPSGRIASALVLEVIITAILMLVILRVSGGSKEKGITAGLAIGATVALAAVFAGPLTGASMNPARSLAPAMIGGRTLHLWIYPVSSVAGALLAVPLCFALRRNVPDPSNVPASPPP